MARSCPCGLDATYDDCCGSLHRGRRAAITAEQLMRSRYSAFVVGDVPYLLRTWHSTTRPSKLQLDDDIKWTGLEILGSTAGSAFHSEGTVEFRANYVLAGHLTGQHENSRFLREDGAWVYVEALTAGGATGR
ncbi:YchJ family metal-binding protein [Kribbella sp. NPDC026596]|uniref:YchJ family protein n=1 Tax=Kribbella sp. NPDC026596 TaxID=3155122 RepID=UPI0033E0A8A6